MPVSRQYCWTCFALIPLEAAQCPRCGADLAAFSAGSYEEKLIAALRHPLSEVRMRAIIALGKRGERRGVRPLLRLALRHPIDVVEGAAVTDSLANLGAGGRKALAVLARRHPASAVRRAARERLGTERGIGR